MLQKLKLKSESFDSWAGKVKEAMDPHDNDDKIELSDLKELLIEAENKKFPDSELLTALTTAVQDAEKCASVAQQLLNNKQRTRTRQSVDTKYKLTVEELTLFYNEIKNLCCELKESDGVKYILDQVIQFQKDAEDLENNKNDDCDYEKLEKCIDFGDSICIELPQLVRLKQKLCQIQWLDEVKLLLDDKKCITRENLLKLIDTGSTIPPNYNVETMLSKLQQLKRDIDSWEERAKIYLQTKSRHNIITLEELIQETNNIDAVLPNLDTLRDILIKAKNWTKLFDEIQGRENPPYYDTLDELVRKGLNIPLNLDGLAIIESTLSAARSWKERTSKTFLRKNAHCTLMEALSPRIGVGVQSFKINKKNSKGDESINSVYVCDTKLDDSSNSANVVAAFKLAEQREMEAMRNLRDRNMSKIDIEDSRYCVCRRPRFGLMLQCELCKDWFHSNCVPLPKTMNKNKITTTTPQTPPPTTTTLTTKETKFLCPCCLRSRRPKLETILTLLVSLQKIPVRLPEGEALHCLTERAMNWQDRAKKSLANDEIDGVLKKLTVLSQKLTDTTGREKITEKIISSELKKAAINTERVQTPLNRVHHSDDSVLSGDDEADDEDDDEEGEAEDDEENDADEDDEEEEEENGDNVTPLNGNKPSCSNFNNGSEHTYSSVSRSQRKSLGQNSDYFIELSENARNKLEELMMEGDLLEISLDETSQIWKILSNTNSPSSVRKYAAFEEVQTNYNNDNNKDIKKRGRKRKSEEFELLKKIGRQKTDDKLSPLAKKKGFNNKDNKDNKKLSPSPGGFKRGPRKVNFFLSIFIFFFHQSI